MDYPIFTTAPDFTNLPVKRVAVAADVVAIAPSKSFVVWPDTQPQTVTRWTFSGDDETQKAELSGFFNRMGGRAGVFLMPSWDRDLQLAALPQIGDEQLSINGTGYAAEYLGDTYPDRDGKYLYIYCPKNGLHVMRVIRAQNGEGVSAVTVEQPLPFTAETGAMLGFVRICRFESDEVEYQHGNEVYWSATLSTRTARVTVDCTRDIPLNDGVAHLLWKPPARCQQELKPAVRVVYNYAFAKGPEVLNTFQAERFSDTWAAWTGESGVYLAKRDSLDPFTITPGDGVLSSLFDETRFATPHLSLAFDESGNEVIAFARHDETKVEIRGYVESEARRWIFDGFSPQLFQFWTLDNEAYDLSDAEIVCIYAKRGTAGIYARFESEDFADEHLLGAFPNVPLRIEYVEVDGTDLRIVCIDDGHREMVLTADYSYSTLEPPRRTTYSIHTSFTLVPMTVETLVTNQTTTRSTASFLTTDTIITYSTTYIPTLKTVPTLYSGYTLEPYTIQTVVPVFTDTDVPAGTDGMGNTVFTQVVFTTDVTLQMITYATVPTEKTTHTITYPTTTVINTETTYTLKTTSQIYTLDTDVISTLETVADVAVPVLETTEFLTYATFWTTH